MNCEKHYLSARHAFLESIDRFDDAESITTNQKVRHFLRTCAELIETMGTLENTQPLTHSIQTVFRRIRQHSLASPIEAFVFLFHREHGEIWISAFSDIHAHRLDDESLVFHRSSNNSLLENAGPVKFTAYELLMLDILYFDEIDGFDMKSVNTSLNELLILKAYSVFEKCFNECINLATLAPLPLQNTVHFFIQEHDGGYANRLNQVA